MLLDSSGIREKMMKKLKEYDFSGGGTAGYRKGHEKRLKRLEKIVALLPGKLVLDIGCAGSIKIKGKMIVGLDVYMEYEPYVKADARHIPFKDNSFDIIVCSHVVEHIEDPLNMLSEAKRVVKKGGHVLVEAPNHVDFRNRIKTMLGKSVLPTKMERPFEQHQWEYTLNELKDLVVKVGLSIISVYAYSESGRGSWKTKLIRKISNILPKTWRHCIGIISTKAK